MNFKLGSATVQFGGNKIDLLFHNIGYWMSQLRRIVLQSLCFLIFIIIFMYAVLFLNYDLHLHSIVIDSLTVSDKMKQMR